MNIQFTLAQLVATILVIIGGSLGVYLVMLVYQLFKAVQRINSILESNKENIDNTLKEIPGIVENVNVITGSVKQKTEIIDSFFGDKPETTGNSGTAGLEAIISTVTSILDIVSEIKSFFGRKKRKIFKVKR